jgi:hypothetical protein
MWPLWATGSLCLLPNFGRYARRASRERADTFTTVVTTVPDFITVTAIRSLARSPGGLRSV